MQTSIAEALKAADLYKDTGRIREEMLVSILPNGERREHKMAEIDYRDLQIFADELDIALQLQNPLVQSLFAKNAVGLASLIRSVNVETASGFKGSVGSGRQLDDLLLRARQFQDPTNPAIGLRTTWVRNIPAVVVAGRQFICAQDALGAEAHAALAMATTEGFALFGFANPAPVPCVNAVQITYVAQAYNIQNLEFEMANPFIGDAICELKQPLYIYPQETALVQTYYNRIGSDELRPIGIWIKMSQALRVIDTS